MTLTAVVEVKVWNVFYKYANPFHPLDDFSQNFHENKRLHSGLKSIWQANAFLYFPHYLHLQLENVLSKKTRKGSVDAIQFFSQSNCE